MSEPKNIDRILRNWAYEPHEVSVRLVRGDDRREVIQMRVDLGLLQLEMAGRPDGTRPQGYESYYDYLVSCVLGEDGEFELSEQQCGEVDREFVQYYHRRVCWLKLQRYRRAVADADHTLALMDFCREYSPDEHWTMSHEQYRPFVLFHRTQALALAELEENGPHAAVQAIDDGLERLREFFMEHDAEEHFDEDDLVTRLNELRNSLREQFDNRIRLAKQLDAAIAAEHYEEAARIRDELANLDDGAR